MDVGLRETLVQIMMSHGKFLQRALAGTVLKSKMVRNLTDLKVRLFPLLAPISGPSTLILNGGR